MGYTMLLKLPEGIRRVTQKLIAVNYDSLWQMKRQLYTTQTFFINARHSLECVIPENCLTIEEGAFEGMKELEQVIFSGKSKLRRIGERAFSHCESLRSIEIPNTVTRIEDSAFSGCKMLGTVKIPNSVTEIGDYAFFGCYSLKSIKIPNSVKVIGEHAFAFCSSLDLNSKEKILKKF